MPTHHASAAETQTIANNILSVTLDADGSFTIESGGQTVVSSGKLGIDSGTIVKQIVHDPQLGEGQQIQINNAASQSLADVRVFDGLPFALLRKTLANKGAEPLLLNRVPVASFAASLGKPAAELRTMGTGGLLAPGKCSGSYVWMAVAEPQSRNGLVTAWLTNDRASGVLIPRVTADIVQIAARADYGHLQILPGDSVQTETLAIGYFHDVRVGLEDWADAVARMAQIRLKPEPVGYCTWYAGKTYGAGNEKSTADLADFAASALKPYGFSFLQIDDHWQLGTTIKGSPKKNFSAADPRGPYPSGMKLTADRIRSVGLTPGLWFMPFAGTAGDPYFADKADLFVHTADGKPYDCTWGGTPLDMTNPKARDYVKATVSRIARDWGYTYLKIDGLWTGLAARQAYVNDAYKEDKFGDAVFFDPTKTNVQAFRDGMKVVREAAGDNVFILGCNMAQNMRMFGPSLGLFDAMRVGPDNSPNWKGWLHSPQAGSREYFLNGRVWYNDPDPQYLRDGFTSTEARTIASWTAVSGGLNTASDSLAELAPDRLTLLRQTMPPHGKLARPVDYLENDPPRVWLVTDGSGTSPHWLIGLFNWSDDDQSFDIALDRFGLSGTNHYTAFDFWGDKFIPDLTGSVKATVAKHGCVILSLRDRVDHPQVVSTSRHICQGMVDLTDEQWVASTSVLAGKSEVIANDEYEMRIALPATWSSGFNATLSAEDQAAGVKLRTISSEGGLRLSITSSATRRVSWNVKFLK